MWTWEARPLVGMNVNVSDTCWKNFLGRIMGGLVTRFLTVKARALPLYTTLFVRQSVQIRKKLFITPCSEITD